jgi:hypothetical protein
MNGTRIARAGSLALGVALTAACGEKGLVYGDPNSIIAVMPSERWDEVAQSVYDAFERTIITVREEKTFTVTYQEPYGEHWVNLRRFRQMLLVGSRSDAWIQEALEEAEVPIDGDGVHQVEDVWSRGQVITLIILPEAWGADDLRPHLEGVADLLDEQYRMYVTSRMFVSGFDAGLADTLEVEAGFHLALPIVYRWHRADSIYVFRNDNPNPSELIREIVVTWLSPAAASLASQDALELRARLVEGYYSEPQDAVLDGMVERPLDTAGQEGIQVQAQWRNPPERGWPAGGPFVTRLITCEGQDRTYFLDGWLYAPGKEKYEYLIQLEAILDSFRCGS